MIVVVATSDDQLTAAGDALRILGLRESGVVSPTGVGCPRRLLLFSVPDAEAGHQAVAQLRVEGYPAVLRPATGPQLEAWMRHTEPTTIGDRLTVSFVWSEHDRSHLPNVVELDPAEGFGSGQHPATRQILEHLVARVSGGERVLDVGCGNGILGLSALRLGAARLVAVDLDRRAVESTQRNAKLNGVGHLVDARSAPLDQIDDEPFDAVLANIGRAALVELGPDLATRVAPGGWLGVSGFSPPQCEVVAASLRSLTIIDRETTEEWAALVLGRGLGASQ